MATCPHLHVAPETIDQTLGVQCRDCLATLAFCWQDNHIPESLWNRACENAADAVPCDQSRDDCCALCGEPMATDSPSIPTEKT